MQHLVLNSQASKEEIYLELLPQMRGLLIGEEDLIANLSNFCAVLKETFNWWWVGFYIVKSGELVLGPFQGPVACTRIAYGRGVCGTSWKLAQTVIVPDVEAFPGHIACSAASKSEIVLPIFDEKLQVLAVLDVDSDLLNHFDEIDEKYLTELVSLLKFS